MIALTQEQRQKRIDWLKQRISSMEECREEIPFGLSEDETMELAAYKDSLASLTAVPVGKFVLERIENRYHHIKHGEHQHTEPKYSMVKLFTAPPVPEINPSSELTALLNAIDSFQVVKASDRWNESGKWDDAYEKLSETAIKAAPLIKRLNGLGE